MVGRSSWKSGSGRETLLEVLRWSGDYFGGPEADEGPSRRSGSGREIVQKVRKWSGGSEVVKRPSRRSGSGRETLLKVQKWSGDPSKGPEMVGDP